MDISIDEDIDKMPVEVLINLFPPSRFCFQALYTSGTILRKKAETVVFHRPHILLKVQASNPGTRLSIDHVDRLTHC